MTHPLKPFDRSHRTLAEITIYEIGIINNFSLNVTTLRSAYGMSRPSVVCLSYVVCNVVAP